MTDRRQRQRRQDDCHTDSGTTPKQLLHEHGQGHAGRVTDQIAVKQRAAEVPLHRLFQHGPGEFLALVVVERDRSDHFLGGLMCSPGQVVLRCRWCQVQARSPLGRGPGPGDSSRGATRTELRGRQVQHHRGHRDGVAFAACQQSGIVR